MRYEIPRRITFSRPLTFKVGQYLSAGPDRKRGGGRAAGAGGGALRVPARVRRRAVRTLRRGARARRRRVRAVRLQRARAVPDGSVHCT